VTFQPLALDDFLLRFYPGEHISPSAVKQHAKCPEQFRRVRILGHKAPPGGAMLLGTAAHEAAGHNFQQKILTEREVPVSEVQDFFRADLGRRIDEAGGSGELDWSGAEWRGKTPAQNAAAIVDAGAKIVSRYHEEVAPDLFPQAVEKELLFQVDGIALPVKGYIDVVASRRDGFTKTMGEPMILERKTRKDRRPPKPEDIFQASIYQLAEPMPVEIQISARSSGETLLHTPVTSTARQTAQMLRATLLEIAANYALYGPDQPWPGKGRLHDWACDFCSLKASCPFWDESFWP